VGNLLTFFDYVVVTVPEFYYIAGIEWTFIDGWKGD